MTTRRHAVPLLCLLAVVSMPVFVVAPPIAQAEPTTQRASPRTVDVAPRFEKGETLVYTLGIDSSMVVTLLGEEQNSVEATMDAEISFTTDTLSVGENGEPSGGASVTMRFDSLKIALRSEAIADGTFDSSSDPADDDPNDPVAQIGRNLVSSTLTLDVLPDGTIAGVDGLQRLAPTEANAAVLFDQLFNERTLISMVQPVFRIRPAEDPMSPLLDGSGLPTMPVSMGESWSLTTPAVNGLGVPAADYDLTLVPSQRGDARQTARIDVSGQPRAMVPGSVRVLNPETQEQSVEGHALWSTRLNRLHTLRTVAKQVFEAQGNFPLKVEVSSQTELLFKERRNR